MSNSTFFTQGCPTCGRRLEVRVEYLGKKLVCRHCHGQFIAADPATAAAYGTEAETGLLRRANELLRFASQRAAQSHQPNPR